METVDQLTDITEYLPLYINQPCDSNIPGHQVMNYGSLTIDKITPENLVIILYNLEQKEKGQFDYQRYYCKPHLRQVSDMTKEEAMGVLRLLYDWKIQEPEFGYQPYDPEWFEDAREYVYINFKGIAFGDVDTYNFQMTIDSKFTCYLGLLRTYNESVTTINQHRVTKYLIEQGFDVFGLIKKDLAIKIGK